MSPSLMQKDLGQAGKSVLTLQRFGQAILGRGGVSGGGIKGGLEGRLEVKVGKRGEGELHKCGGEWGGGEEGVGKFELKSRTSN